MKAIAKIKPGKGVSLIDIPIPEPKDNEVLIKVESSAICGTDIHLYNWDLCATGFLTGIPFPAVIGHEMAGTVVAVGDKVNQSRIGQRVSFETHPYCGECYMCRSGNRHICINMGRYKKYQDGAFAEYKLATENALYALPDNISFEQGSLYEPGSVAMYAFEDSYMKPGDFVVIYGCGPIGLMAMQIFKACGAGMIIGVDINKYRLDMAKKYSDIVINGAEEPVIDIVKDISKPHCGADVIVEATGAASIYNTVFKIARPEAHVVLIGHPNGAVPINIMKDINLKELNIKGHFGRKIWSSWDKLNALESSKRINLLDTVTHRFTLEQFEEAFQTSAKDAGKVLFMNSK